MSKNTKYFGTIEEAKQYFPDGVPSNVIAIVGDGSQVLVSSDNAATNTQQYYNADLTNDEIVNTMVQDSYDEGHSDGYSEGETAGYESGYAEGVADGGANWLDVLYLDEKAKAESFLGISDWGLSDFYKYNFAKYATSEPYIDQQSALAFISGLQTNKTLWKLIKISKDADGNAVITYNQCSINFDGTNVGSFELDSNTYNNKICIWGTLTLAAGDEVIMDCATTITDPESGDVYALGLFGGFDDETNDPATFKCETAGTYTFGVWIDPPQVQDGEAACFVSTAFNYTGSATVPAIAVPTGEASATQLYTDSQKFAISSADMMTKGSLNIINYGTMSPYNFDKGPWTNLTVMAEGNYAVLYKWSGDTMTCLPFYTNCADASNVTSVFINVGTQDELEIKTDTIYATATLAAGDKICCGFYVADEYDHVGQFSGITSASSVYTVETAGDYIILIYLNGYDDNGMVLTTVVSSNPYNASGTVIQMQPAQS